MDVVLETADTYVFDAIYSENYPREHHLRMACSLYCITVTGAYVLYLSFAALNFTFFFDKRLMLHPKWLDNQIQKELLSACSAVPAMALLTLPFFLAEVNGKTKLYGTIEERGVPYLLLSSCAFLMWNDCLIYWVHRWLHAKPFYKTLHKEHHRWLVPSPFASHAFHPVDGFLQSLPYHLFLFVVPLHKWVYFSAFILVNFWTISIHDQNYSVPGPLQGIVNGAAHHTDHHLYFNYNYGQYFTLWDRIGGSFREPSPFLGKGPKDDLVRLGLVTKNGKGKVKGG